MRPAVVWLLSLAAALVVQTALLGVWVPDPWRPDLTRVLVLWVALTGVPRGGVVWPALAGLAVDAASGAPLGLTSAMRLLLYGAARPFRGMFFDDQPLFLLPLALLGPLADVAVVQTLARFAYLNPVPAGVAVAVAARQAAVDLVLAPAAFVALEMATGRRGRFRLPV